MNKFQFISMISGGLCGTALAGWIAYSFQIQSDMGALLLGGGLAIAGLIIGGIVGIWIDER